jgi:tRNA-Thr(GGU) m(6)t(6)A37 methyltransferase TsaA
MDILVKPIGYVKNQVKERKDDNWKKVISTIILYEYIPISSILGIEQFSHLEVVFNFNEIMDSEIIRGAHHPRSDSTYPKIGIFSQRASKRPNLIGTTIVKIMEVKNRNILVNGLDAIDGTPIIDLKPVMKEFLPLRDEIYQPDWSKEIMKKYW